MLSTSPAVHTPEHFSHFSCLTSRPSIAGGGRVRSLTGGAGWAHCKLRTGSAPAPARGHLLADSEPWGSVLTDSPCNVHRTVVLQERDLNSSLVSFPAPLRREKPAPLSLSTWPVLDVFRGRLMLVAQAAQLPFSSFILLTSLVANAKQCSQGSETLVNARVSRVSD